MNIQPIGVNQNRQQNFGMNFEVAKISPDAKVTTETVIATMQRLVELMPEELKGNLTVAMQKAKMTTFLVRQDEGNLTFTHKPSGCKKVIWHGFLDDAFLAESIRRRQANIQGQMLLDFIERTFQIPQEATTTKAVMDEMNFIAIA